MSSRKTEIDEKREFVRIRDVLPMEVVVMDPSKRDTVRSREIIASAPVERIMSEGYETEDSRVLRYLSAVNAKLDLLIQHLMADQERLGDLEQQPVNLSASGIRFQMSQSPAIGTLLELRIMLPGPSAAAVCIYGEVVRTGPSNTEGKHDVSARFVGMDEEIQEHVMRYIFNRQREEIRRRREEA